MVSAGVCFNGRGWLHFIPEKTKVNAKHYVDTLIPKLVADCKTILPAGFIFQQDGAPAHTARVAQLDWVTTNCTGFIGKDEWPPNSPDLNPLDCAINHCFASLNSPVYYISTVDNILTFWWCFLSGNFINWPLSLWTPIASCIINLNKYNLVQMCEVECQSGAINFGAKSKMVYFLRYSSFSSGERDGRYRYYRPVQSIVVSEMTLGGY